MREVCEETKCPLLIAGDIFHKWKTSPEVVNRAIMEFRQFPCQVYAIPGQHDLPYHSYKDMDKSSYGTLVRSEAINNLPPGNVIDVQGWRTSGSDSFVVVGFPWGEKLKNYPTSVYDTDKVKIALVHSYVWNDGYSYPNADSRQKSFNYVQTLDRFKVLVFGDNHKGFREVWTHYDLELVNNGGFIRRNSDELAHQPSFSLVYKDGTTKRFALDCSKDEWEDEVTDPDFKEQEHTGEMMALVEMLEKSREVSMDFSEMVARYMTDQRISRRVKRLVLKILEQ